MLQGSMIEGNTSIVELQDLNHETLKLVLQHIYGQKINFNRENIWELYTLAHYWELQALKTRCIKYIRRMVNSEQIWEFTNLAVTVYQDPELIAACVRILKTVRNPFTWGRINSIDISEDTIMCVLKMGVLEGRRQAGAFNSLYKWAL